MVAKNWVLPKATGSRSKTGPMRLAQGQKPTGGYVLDYVTVSGGFTNYNFQGDTTYYVSGTLSLYGTNTFEGGTVIKYATNGAIQITPGPGTTPGVIWGGSAYRPVILTAKDDNSVGESFGSGTPSGYYGAPMMLLAGFSPQTSLIGSRFAFANTGIMLNGGSNAKFYSAQFVQCQNGISIVGGTAFIGNGLFANTKTNLVYASGGGIVNAQNVTFSGSSLLATAPGTQMGNYLALTNCNLVNVTNLVAGVLEATNGNYNGFFQSPYFSPLAPVGFINVNQPFQSAGGGGYYLATNSPWHNVGTTNLDPYLLSELATKTTYPPIVYSFLSGNYSNSANLFPQAIRDAYGSPDLGYHYDPLDYLVGGLFITNGTIIFNTGTAVGIYATTSMYQYGIGINGQAQFVSIGAPNNLNHVAFYNTVQEGSVTNWVKASEGLIMSWYGTNQQYQCQFTDWSVMAQDSWLIWKYFYITNGSPEAFQNCQFHGGQLETDYPTFCLTNCLFDRVYLGLYPSDANLSVFRNNLFYGGTFDFAPAMTNSIIADNSFNQTAIPDEMAGVGTWYFGGHNAYVTNFNLLVPTLAGDLIQSNLPVYQTSWYGNYYLPTNSTLIQAGSTTANLIGLYHFTTQTNQMPEGDAVVDIGYHYVGTDQYGNPLDTNGDGIPDYVEDSNGNGIFDTGDLGDWHISPYGLNAQNHLQVFTPLK